MGMGMACGTLFDRTAASPESFAARRKRYFGEPSAAARETSGQTVGQTDAHAEKADGSEGGRDVEVCCDFARGVCLYGPRCPEGAHVDVRLSVLLRIGCSQGNSCAFHQRVGEVQARDGSTSSWWV